MAMSRDAAWWAELDQDFAGVREDWLELRAAFDAHRREEGSEAALRQLYAVVNAFSDTELRGMVLSSVVFDLPREESL